MKLGLTEEEYLLLEEVLIEPLKKLGAKVWCFGSRATGKYAKYSDLDLLVEHPNDISSELSLLEEKISDSNFPYKVDLIISKNLAQSYLRQVELQKVRL